MERPHRPSPWSSPDRLQTHAHGSSPPQSTPRSSARPPLQFPQPSSHLPVAMPSRLQLWPRPAYLPQRSRLSLSPLVPAMAGRVFPQPQTLPARLLAPPMASISVVAALCSGDFYAQPSFSVYSQRARLLPLPGLCSSLTTLAHALLWSLVVLLPQQPTSSAEPSPSSPSLHLL